MVLKGRIKQVVHGIAGLVLLILFSPYASPSPLTIQQKKAMAREQYDRAEQMREALNGRAQAERTRHEYERVIDAYRRVYYTTPAATKADASIVAHAELLAEMGRLFHDSKALREAISTFKFLRKDYPGSKYRMSALFTIAQIHRIDLDDETAAKTALEDFVEEYPRSRLTQQARKQLAEMKPPAAAPGATAKQVPAAEAKQVPDVEKKRNGLSTVNGIRFWSTPDYTRVAIDVDEEVKYDAARLPHPDRIFFDLYNSRLSSTLMGKSFEVGDGFLRTIRTAPYQKDVVRIVLDVQDVSEYSVFLLPNPYRLIIDVHGRKPAKVVAKSKVKIPAEPASKAKAKEPAPEVATQVTEAAPREDSRQASEVEVAEASVPEPAPSPSPEPTPTAAASAQAEAAQGNRKAGASGFKSAGELHTAEAKPVPTPNVGAWDNRRPGALRRGEPVEAASAAEPKLKSAEQMRREAAEFERKYKQAEAKGETLPEPNNDLETVKVTARPTTKPTYESVVPRNEPAGITIEKVTKGGKKTKVTESEVAEIHAAAPTARGQRSLIRALGLKIGKIVVDAGHGGHDTGTVGPSGLMEKDLVLDVSMRLGRLLETRMNADVVYTRDDDTFIPLETRTATANQEQADLFISVHANSSSDANARGVETYYLNFTSEPAALEVAARENAVSQKSIHELQDLVKKITLKDKIEESRELAGSVQQSLTTGLTTKARPMRNRGVKKAPFIVLIGANMPSVLAEISFLSNPGEERRLKKSEYRQQIAESLYKGIAKYVNSLSSFKVAQVTGSGE